MAAAKKKTGPNENLEAALAQIEKQYGKGSVMKMGDKLDMQVEVIPTGVLALDIALGVGGIPRGRVIELYGHESGGKSTLAMHIVAQAQIAGGICAYVDAEHCLAEGTRIYDAEDGINRPVEWMFQNKPNFLASSAVDGNIINQKGEIRKSSDRETFAVKTTYGRTIELTNNHRVLTHRGWLRIDELAVGDTMYAPASLPSPTESALEPTANEVNLYRLLGYHISDGVHGVASISSTDPSVEEDLRSMAAGFDLSITREKCSLKVVGDKKYVLDVDELLAHYDSGCTIEELATSYGVSRDLISERLASTGKVFDHRAHGLDLRMKRRLRREVPNVKISKDRNNEIHKFLAQFECFYNYSKDRHLPPNLNDWQLREVLRGMFVSDGTVVGDKGQAKCHFSYSTSSPGLALDVQTALLRGGVTSTISFDVKKAPDGSDYAPNYQVGVSIRNNVQRLQDWLGLYGYKGDRLNLAIETVRNCERRSLIGEMMELTVESIESTGVKATYDVSIDALDFDHQNFVANGLIVHNSMDPTYAAALGVDTSELLISQPDSGEQALEITDTLVRSGAIDLIVIDSVAALTPRAEIEGEMGDTHVGLQARMMSQALRKLTANLNKTKTSIIFINQIREKIGVSWGSNETTPGGRALKFYSSVRLDIRRIGAVKVGEEIVGNETRIKVVKNKVAPPFTMCEVQMIYGEGFSNELALISLGLDYGILSLRGAWIAYGDQQIGNGKEKTRLILKDHPELAAEIENKIRIASGLIEGPEEEEVPEVVEEDPIGEPSVPEEL